ASAHTDHLSTRNSPNSSKTHEMHVKSIQASHFAHNKGRTSYYGSQRHHSADTLNTPQFRVPTGCTNPCSTSTPPKSGFPPTFRSPQTQTTHKRNSKNFHGLPPAHPPPNNPIHIFHLPYEANSHNCFHICRSYQGSPCWAC